MAYTLAQLVEDASKALEEHGDLPLVTNYITDNFDVGSTVSVTGEYCTVVSERFRIAPTSGFLFLKNINNEMLMLTRDRHMYISPEKMKELFSQFESDLFKNYESEKKYNAVLEEAITKLQTPWWKFWK